MVTKLLYVTAIFLLNGFQYETSALQLNEVRFKRNEVESSSNSIVMDHEEIKNLLPPATDGEAFDKWARAMKLNDMTLDGADDGSAQTVPQNNTEIVAQVGGTATLSCFTGLMSDEMVTWLKGEDDQLLSVGQQVYVPEDRHKVSQSHRTKAWELYIQAVHPSDAGQYECQLTTHPPVSYFFNLRVTQAVATIIGSSEVHIEEGSQLALECQVQNATIPPIFIFWYHNASMINYNKNLLVRTENFTSSLVVSKVNGTDAGVYSCEPHLATRANVTVHVVTGERPAAMQHGDSSGGSLSSHHLYSVLPTLVTFLLFHALHLLPQK